MNKMFRSIKQHRAAATVGALALASQAHAALDVAPGTTEIAAVVTAVGTVFAAILLFVVAKWGGKKVIGLFGR